MGYIDVVNEQDEVVGSSEFIEAHKKGLRHRSIQILVFQESDLENLLVSQRSKDSKSAPLKFGPSVGGHVDSGQSYLEAARKELGEELFAGEELPDIDLVEVSKYPNVTTYKVPGDTDSVNREISCLFYAVHNRLFKVGEEFGRVFWENRHKVLQAMKNSPEDYTPSFVNAMEKLEEFLSELS